MLRSIRTTRPITAYLRRGKSSKSWTPEEATEVERVTQIALVSTCGKVEEASRSFLLMFALQFAFFSPNVAVRQSICTINHSVSMSTPIYSKNDKKFTTCSQPTRRPGPVIIFPDLPLTLKSRNSLLTPPYPLPSYSLRPMISSRVQPLQSPPLSLGSSTTCLHPTSGSPLPALGPTTSRRSVPLRILT